MNALASTTFLKFTSFENQWKQYIGSEEGPWPGGGGRRISHIDKENQKKKRERKRENWEEYGKLASDGKGWLRPEAVMRIIWWISSHELLMLRSLLSYKGYFVVKRQFVMVLSCCLYSGCRLTIKLWLAMKPCLPTVGFV